MKSKYPGYFNLLAQQNSTRSQHFDWNEAQALHKKLKSIANLHTDNNNDGCISRSELIQELLETRGLSHGFAMVEFDNGPWKSHFAAFIILDNGDKIVIDPVEFDKAISLEEWKAHWLKRDEVDERSYYEQEGFLQRPPPQKSLALIQKLLTADAV